MLARSVSVFDLEIRSNGSVYEVHADGVTIKTPSGTVLCDGDRNIVQLILEDFRDVEPLPLQDDRLQFTGDVSSYEIHCTIVAWRQEWERVLAAELLGEMEALRGHVQIDVGDDERLDPIREDLRAWWVELDTPQQVCGLLAKLSVADKACVRLLRVYHGSPVWLLLMLVQGLISNRQYAAAATAIQEFRDPDWIDASVGEQMRRFSDFRRGAWVAERLLFAWRSSVRFLVQSGESDVVEFKSTCRYDMKNKKLNKMMTYTVVRTIAAFFNTAGGTLIIGLEDDGSSLAQLVKLDGFQNEDKYVLYVVSRIADLLGRLASVRTDAAFEDYGGNRVCVVRCKRSDVPVYLRSQNEEEFVVRDGPSTVRLAVSEAVEYIRNEFSEYWNKQTLRSTSSLKNNGG